MTVGERVRQLREMHGLTQLALQKEVPGLTQSRLSRLEGGLSEVDSETLELIAIELNVKTDLFYRESVSDLKSISPHLRARSRLTQSAKASAIHWAQVVLDEYQLLEGGRRGRTELEELRGSPAREAARSTRNALGFGSIEPLPYLLLAIERLGTLVLGLPTSKNGLDAFCAWIDDRPIMAILDGSPPDRIRWSVAHELGHLVLHRDQPKSARLEEEADEFAAELLTPLAGLRGEMPSNPQLQHLTVLKSRWGVSVKSLVRRAKELGVVDSDRAISLYRQISARGWNKKEPGFVPEEKPRAFHKLAEMAYGNPISVDKMADAAGWSELLTSSVLQRHADATELPFETGPRSNGESKVVDLAGIRRERRTSRP